MWWESEILRAQLLKYSKKDRQKIIETADINTRWERYAYSRFSNIPSGEKLPMNKLIGEIEMTFDFVLRGNHIRRLYRIKQRVYNQRRKTKNIGK